LHTIKAPQKNRSEYQLVVQAWDFDLLKKNDYICEWVLDISHLLQQVRETQQPIQLTQKYYQTVLKEKMRVKLEFTDDDSFWISVKGKDNKEIKLRLDVRIFPGAIAKQNPVGEGRNEPNMLPHLPPPIGRIEFSLNPFKMLAQLVNKEYLKKLYAIIGVLLCVAACIMIAPMVVSNLISALTMKIIGLN
jgi:hypothetical protein